MRTAENNTQFVMIDFNTIDNGNLTFEEIGMLVVLKRFENNLTHQCFPSEKRLMKLGKKSKNTVKKIARGLEEKGKITITERKKADSNANDTNLYTILYTDVERKPKKTTRKPKKEVVEVVEQSKEQSMKDIEALEQVEHEKTTEKSIYDSCNFEGFSKSEIKKLIVLAESKGMNVKKFDTYLEYMRNQRKKNKINDTTAYMNTLDEKGVTLDVYRDGETGANTSYTKPRKNAFNNFEQRKYDWDKLDLLLYNSSPVDCDRRVPLRKTIETNEETDFYNQMIAEAERKRYERVSNF